MIDQAVRVATLLLRPWLRWRSRPARVQELLRDLPYQDAVQPSLPQVRIAGVQFNINLAPSATAFARHAHQVVYQAVLAGAGLVLLPEYTSLPLLGLLPGVQRLARALAQSAAGQRTTASEQQAQTDYATMALAFRLAAPAAQRVYWATLSTLAARFRVTLLAGSLIEMGPSGQLRNVAYLFGPDGKLLARQVKTHLMPAEVEMGFTVGRQITVVNTPAGRIAFPVCMDHTYFETARIAALSGADLLIDPSANSDYYCPYAQARGIWNRVQEVQTYGVLCCGVGEVAGIVFQGRSGVYAPLAMTAAGDGVLAMARSADQEEIVLADLDYAALDQFRQQHPLEYNLALYRRYLPEVYKLRVC